MSEKKIAILQQMTSSFAATDNIRMTADLMLELAMNYTNAEKGSLMLLNEQAELTIFTARGLGSQLIKTYRGKMGQGIAGIVAEQRVPVLVEDIEKDKRFQRKRRDRYKTRSFISCPIVSKNRLLGVLNINDKNDNTAFTEDEFTLIKIMSDQAAIALDNAFLLNQVKTGAAELEDMNRKLIESDILKTEFLVRMSHELRTPLNAINGSIYYLKKSDHIANSQQKDFYGIIAKETDKLVHIVENLLNFLRLDDESRLMKKSIMSLSDILNDASNSRSLKMFLAKKNLRLDVHLPKSVPDIVGDKTRVSQLFINMIEGLSYYLQRDDSMDITVVEDDLVTVLVRCSRSMPDSLISSYFHPATIFTAEQSEERLKLYLAGKVIESHNWKMTAENTDEGFCLRISIPKSTRQKIDAVVNTTTDMFIDLISDMLGVDICSIMLIDNFAGDLTIKSARGLNNEVINRTRIRIGDSIAGWVAMEGRPLFIENIETDRHFMRKNINQYHTKSLISVPIKIQDRVIGVINLNNKKTKAPFTIEDFFTASMLSERISFFFERLYSGNLNEDALRQFVTSFDNLLATCKKYHNKGDMPAQLIFKIMERLGATEKEKSMAVYIAMVYDLGLVSISEDISKRKRLTPEEEHIVRAHPHTTVDLLGKFEFSGEVRDAILHHHERYDGTGYPDGLRGEEIPFISRILHVVDAFCAMTTAKPYRRKKSTKDALEEIRKHAGSLYDPVVVRALEGVHVA